MPKIILLRHKSLHIIVKKWQNMFRLKNCNTTKSGTLKQLFILTEVKLSVCIWSVKANEKQKLTGANGAESGSRFKSPKAPNLFYNTSC